MLEMTHREIDQLLAQARIGRLCMATPDGRPYSLPFPFCWTDGSLYLRVALSGRKGELLRANDQVCFEVDTFTDNLDDYASVLVEGRLIPVDNVNEKAAIKHLNDAKYDRLRNGYRPGHGRSTPLEKLPLRKIVVERLTGRKREPQPVDSIPNPSQSAIVPASTLPPGNIYVDASIVARIHPLGLALGDDAAGAAGRHRADRAGISHGPAHER